MTAVEELNKRWQAAAARRIAADMAFDGEFLTLGAGTRLAKIDAPVDQARLGALLAAAHSPPITPSSLRHLLRATERWADDKPLALTHLALSGLAKLVNPAEDARRLFLAEALIQAGVQPSALMKALGLGAGPWDEVVDKYNPDQPRVSAGNGPSSGQWTTGDWTSEAANDRQAPASGVQVADASTTRGRELVSDAAVVAYPGEFHDQVLEEQIEAYRKAGAECVSEVRLQFSGITARLDILRRTASGIILGVEIKTGDDPEFTVEQRIVYPHTLTGEGVSSPDPKIESLGAPPGEPLPPFPIFLLRADGPGLPYRFYGPKASE